MVEEGLDSGNALDRTENGQFVEVMFAKSTDQASVCCDFLEQQQIPARLEPAAVSARSSGVAVLVPADRLVEASELLASLAHDEEEEVGDEDVDDVDDELDGEDDDLDEDDEDDDYEDDADDEDEDEEEDYPNEE
jgi:hypothetical protein